METEPSVDLGRIFRAHGDDYRARHPVSPEQSTVLRRLSACRTAALGGHVDSCDGCGLLRVSYNSCRDRHCPKCQWSRQEKWLEERLTRLLPVEHFHVVFTLPDALNPLATKNRRIVYDLLFRAASETLLELAADPRRLGAQIGVTAVLHTWGQNLLLHPHLHCVVTGGGLSFDQERWIAARQGYLFPVKVMGRLFRGKFLAALDETHRAGELYLGGSVAALASPTGWAKLLSTLYRRDWIVYAKPPFGGAEHVFRYLGRYTHRVAITNRRILELRDGRVRFRYKDYADGAKTKQMTLDADEFVRRFLLHVLPKRFVRIRHYGLLAGRNVSTKLERARELLGGPKRDVDAQPSDEQEPQSDVADDPPRCPRCSGLLRRFPLVTFDWTAPTPATFAPPVAILDSS